MGDVLAIMYIALILFFCGLVLLILASDAIRKLGFYMLIIGLILFIMCLLYSPHTHEKSNFYQDNTYRNV